MFFFFFFVAACSGPSVLSSYLYIYICQSYWQQHQKLVRHQGRNCWSSCSSARNSSVTWTWCFTLSLKVIYMISNTVNTGDPPQHSLRVSGYICDMLHTQSSESCGAPFLTGFYLTLKSVFLPPMWRLKVQFVPWKVAVVDGTLLLLLSRTAGKSAMEWERRVLPAAQQQPGCNRRLCRDGKRIMHKSCESHTLTVLKLYVSEPL